jgi:hypothetical protein
MEPSASIHDFVFEGRCHDRNKAAFDTIHENTQKDINKIFVLVRVISWIVSSSLRAGDLRRSQWDTNPSRRWLLSIHHLRFTIQESHAFQTAIGIPPER